MIKTNSRSRFSLLTLDQIRDSREVILQAEKTESKFTDSDRACYLCEVVNSINYNRQTLEDATSEIIRLNRIIERRDRRISFLEKKLYSEGTK